jgi:hypothetical protein
MSKHTGSYGSSSALVTLKELGFKRLCMSESAGRYVIAHNTFAGGNLPVGMDALVRGAASLLKISASVQEEKCLYLDFGARRNMPAFVVAIDPAGHTWYCEGVGVLLPTQFQHAQPIFIEHYAGKLQYLAEGLDL